MTKQSWNLTQEAFDRLLAWLDSDREQAGKKYEDIRYKLIKFFTCRGCEEPEDLADETINRVTKKVPEIANTYQGDPAAYFLGVAKHVLKERFRKKTLVPELLPQPGREAEIKYECLEKCMRNLNPPDRELMLNYYQEEKRAKIENRKYLAEKLGIGANALRIRAFKMRAKISRCVLVCFQRQLNNIH